MKELAEAEGKQRDPQRRQQEQRQKGGREKRPLKNPGANCRETRTLTRPGQRRGKVKETRSGGKRSSAKRSKKISR